MIEDINTELLEACEAALEELRLLISEDELVFKQVELRF